MVVNNLRLTAILLLFITLNSISFATPQLLLFTDKVISSLGRPIRAELYGISLNTKITEVNLDRLSKNFGVVTDYVINDTRDDRWPDKKIQILKLKLYPRHSGLIQIPSLSTNNVISKIRTIQITKGKTGEPKVIFTEKSPYHRQQIVVHVSVLSSEANSRLAIKEGQTIKGVDSTPLHFKRIKNDNGTYRLQIGWAISALKSGTLKLNFPPIEYSVSGVSRKQFYLPIREIKVKPLPAYLPPTIPVGKITIRSNLLTKYFLQTDSLSYWDIKISGQLNNAYRLPPILRQIKSSKQTQFLPSNTVRSVKATEDNVVSTAHYSIPFKSLKSGFLTLPNIQLQYFDPGNGKIITFNHQVKSAFVLSIFWRNLIIIFFGLLLIFIFIKGRNCWQQIKFSKQKRGQALNLLLQNDNIENIRKVTQLLAEAEHWPTNTTVSQWAGFWKDKYKVDDSFENLISQLSSLLYCSEKNIDINKINQRMLALINNRIKR